MELHGIDVSTHQGKIDWDKVKADFAVIRLGYSKYAGGLVEDEYFRRNADECERHGIPYGVYVYSYDRTITAAEATAADTVRLLAGRKIVYPVYYDIEGSYAEAGLRTDIVNIFCLFIRQAGYTPGVYSYYAFFKQYLDVDKLQGIEKWVADYRGKRPTDISHEMWQYTGSGNADGVNTKVDLNICYKDYAGSEEKEDSEVAKLIKEIKEVLKRYEHD